jgi:gas vesicle protein
MRKFSMFMAGLFLGGIVGSVVAIFVAPVSGEELQERIRNEIQRIKDEVKTAAEMRRMQLERELEELRRPKKIDDIETF